MAAFYLRSGTPGVRLELALAASLAVHLAVLLPGEWWLPRMSAPQLPPLAVRLVPPEQTPPEQVREFATHPETFARTPPVVAPASALQPAARPRELQGRALDTALAALAREEFYPRVAIERGWEGRVVLLLSADPDGRVTGIEVASPSGYPVLDRAALSAATSIVRLPGGQRQALLPVEFRLE